MILTLVISLTILKPRMLQLNNSKAYKLREIKNCLNTIDITRAIQNAANLNYETKSSITIKNEINNFINLITRNV